MAHPSFSFFLRSRYTRVTVSDDALEIVRGTETQGQTIALSRLTGFFVVLDAARRRRQLILGYDGQRSETLEAALGQTDLDLLADELAARRPDADKRALSLPAAFRASGAGDRARLRLVTIPALAAAIVLLVVTPHLVSGLAAFGPPTQLTAAATDVARWPRAGRVIVAGRALTERSFSFSTKSVSGVLVPIVAADAAADAPVRILLQAQASDLPAIAAAHEYAGSVFLRPFVANRPSNTEYRLQELGLAMAEDVLFVVYEPPSYVDVIVPIAIPLVVALLAWLFVGWQLRVRTMDRGAQTSPAR